VNLHSRSAPLRREFVGVPVEFFTDAPIVVLPVSWQDTGSGVFTIAVAALALGIGPWRPGSGRRIAAVAAALAGLSAFLVDVYLY
jgi:hypothetical protein